MSSKTTVAPVFTRTREYVKRFVVLDDDSVDVVSTWVLHTWLFSPACETPPTTPYLYITAPKGSAKTLLGQDVLSTVVRNAMNTVGITGPGLIRLVGGGDDEDAPRSDPNGFGGTVSVAPTLTIDEVDALYSGSKDEVLRMMLNAGYRRGGVVPRVVGKSVVNYSAFCPKILMGIDNGHLPDTVTDRSIRINLRQATEQEMTTVEPFYQFEVEDEAAELSQALSTWAKQNSQAIKAYKPQAIGGLRPRQWEISRTLVQVANAVGNEDRIRQALYNLITAAPVSVDPKIRLYTAIRDMFDESGEDRLMAKSIVEKLIAQGIGVPGNSPTGLSKMVSHDGAKSGAIRFFPGQGGVQKGFYRYQFDEAFARYLGAA